MVKFLEPMQPKVGGKGVNLDSTKGWCTSANARSPNVDILSMDGRAGARWLGRSMATPRSKYGYTS